MLTANDLTHLLITTSKLCWWCQERSATTGEHKFKRSDLARLMSDGPLLWGDGLAVRELRGKSAITRDRYGVVKFPKSMCGLCNNERSKPFDNAYDVYAKYLNRYSVRLSPSVVFPRVFGENWEPLTLSFARYYAKHFGCRMVRAGLPVPQSLRSFMNGASDMTDAHMALVTTDSVHKRHKKGLWISPDYVTVDNSHTNLTSYVLAAYVGSIGVRYEWRREGIPERSQFSFSSSRDQSL